MSPRAPEVSVVVPVFGNAATLEALAARVGAAFSARGTSYEVLLVDDASPDDSLAVAWRLAAADPAVGVVALARNVGQQRAVLAGFAEARGRWLAVLDADLQDPPEALPALLEHARAHRLGAVFAGRVGRYQSRGRMATSKLFKRSLAALAGIPRDAGMCLVADRRLAAAAERFPDRRPWLPAIVGLAGLPAASLPVARSLRPSGRSAYSGWRRLRLAAAALAFAARWRWLGGAGRGRPEPVRVAERLAPRVGS